MIEDFANGLADTLDERAWASISDLGDNVAVCAEDDEFGMHYFVTKELLADVVAGPEAVGQQVARYWNEGTSELRAIDAGG